MLALLPFALIIGGLIGALSGAGGIFANIRPPTSAGQSALPWPGPAGDRRRRQTG